MITSYITYEANGLTEEQVDTMYQSYLDDFQEPSEYAIAEYNAIEVARRANYNTSSCIIIDDECIPF